MLFSPRNQVRCVIGVPACPDVFLPAGTSEDDLILAICSTMKNPSKDVLQSWLSYHFSIGFSLVLLFLDDPSDDLSAATSEMVAKQFGSEVLITRHDEMLRKEWESLTIFADYRQKLDDQMARQILNAEVAVGIARKKKISWLLHIDGDELFFTPALDARPHFDMLSSKKNIYQVCWRSAGSWRQ